MRGLALSLVLLAAHGCAEDLVAPYEATVGQVVVTAQTEMINGLFLARITLRNVGAAPATVFVSDGHCQVLTKGWANPNRSGLPRWNQMRGETVCPYAGSKVEIPPFTSIVISSPSFWVTDLGVWSGGTQYVNAAAKLDGITWTEVTAGSVEFPMVARAAGPSPGRQMN